MRKLYTPQHWTEFRFAITHRVTYAECTVGNHIYHSRYLDLLEAARGEFIRSLGSTVLELQENDIHFSRHRGAVDVTNFPRATTICWRLKSG